MSAEEFLDRVFPRIDDLSDDRFNSVTWRYHNRPTSEGVGLMPHPDTDIEAMVECILDVEGYPDNVRYVDEIEVIDRESDSEVTYIQRMNLPLIGRIQVQIQLADYGEMNGLRVVAWQQDDEATDALNKKQGARTAYNLGAWLLRDDAVLYALSSAPKKDDLGKLKYLAMTKGADAGAGEVIRQNIDGMLKWAHT